MIMRFEKIQEFEQFVKRLDTTGAILLVEQSSDLSSGAIGLSGQLIGFNPQTSFKLLLQSHIGSYYFEIDVLNDDEETLSKIGSSIETLKGSVNCIEVAKLEIDKSHFAGTISL